MVIGPVRCFAAHCHHAIRPRGPPDVGQVGTPRGYEPFLCAWIQLMSLSVLLDHRDLQLFVPVS